MEKQIIGIAFGGISPEHEVSIITSLQAAAAMDRKRYEPVALYLAKDGTWYTGSELLDIEQYGDLPAVLKKAVPIDLVPGGARSLHIRERKGLLGLLGGSRERALDLVFMGLHGGSGENGGMQGLCEVLDVPYTGSGPLASALAMDKVRAKAFCAQAGVPVVPSVRLREYEWAGREDEHLRRFEERLGYPMIVKPVRLGSSVGIGRAGDRPELDAAVEEALRYDEEVIVEEAVTPLREINCSVIGDEDRAEASILEEPVSASGFLSYRDKYMSGGSSSKSGSAAKGTGTTSGMASQERIIPAPVSDETSRAVRELAVRIFQHLGCSGVARIDFLMNGETEEIFFNEINTIPGSLSFYLWEPTGLPFDALVQRLIDLGFSRYETRTNRVRSYDVNLLAEHAARGLKSSKS